MRTLFTGCKTRREVKNLFPWAEKIKKVEGGYMLFESLTDYLTWQNQMDRNRGRGVSVRAHRILERD